VQKIRELETSIAKNIIIELINNSDFKTITKAKYFFNWHLEKENTIFKLILEDDNEILGLISLKYFISEERIEIKLLAVSKENRGKIKKYDGIAENLIAFACREAVKLYAENACVSLYPKTELKKQYIERYGMLIAGKQLYLEGLPLFRLLEKNGL
jgi:N-acetylglutamate synthase-like GNAT family acetyltransferase